MVYYVGYVLMAMFFSGVFGCFEEYDPTDLTHSLMAALLGVFWPILVFMMIANISSELNKDRR